MKTKPVPWYSIFAVFMLGVLQIAAGVCLTLLGAGNVGPGLIAEGVADFVVGITTCVTGEFSWKDYLKNKALSIGVMRLTYYIIQVSRNVGMYVILSSQNFRLAYC